MQNHNCPTLVWLTDWLQVTEKTKGNKVISLIDYYWLLSCTLSLFAQSNHHQDCFFISIIIIFFNFFFTHLAPPSLPLSHSSSCTPLHSKMFTYITYSTKWRSCTVLRRRARMRQEEEKALRSWRMNPLKTILFWGMNTARDNTPIKYIILRGNYY